MGKLAVLLTLGVAGSVVSVGGAYMLGAFGSGHKNIDIPVSLQDFVVGEGGRNIISGHFPGVSLESEGANWTDAAPQDGFLGTDKTKGEGRLVVNWEKFKCSPDQSGKLTGRIRWLWTFVNGDKGLLLYAAAKMSDSETSKLDVEGVIYTLEKEQNKWKIKQNKKKTATATDGQAVDLEDDKFPVVGDKFKDVLKVSEYWGFTTAPDKLTKFCQPGIVLNSKDKPKEIFRGSWTWKHEVGKSDNPLDWSKSDHAWLTTFYGTFNPNLANLVSGFSGKWSEEYFENKSFGVTIERQ